MNLGKKFLEFLDTRVERFGGAQYKTFGVFGIINYPLGYFMLHLLGAEESIFARLTATLLCIPLIFTKSWPVKLMKYLNLYWFLTLLYCLPIFGTYTLLKNHLSVDWMLNFSIGLFILFLIVDYILLIILYVFGILLGSLLFIFSGQEIILQQGIPTNFIYIYVAMIIIGCIFSRNKEMMENQRLQGLKTLAGAIAHEMRTPLSTINYTAHRLKKYLPILIKSYNSSKNEDESSEFLDKEQLDSISDAPESIERTNRSAFAFIDILLMNLKEDLKEKPTKICSIQKCIEDTLMQYSFGHNERNLVSYAIHDDFKFRGDYLLMKHVLFNLLKNSIYYVRAANKGNITITSCIEKGVNRLYFRDTGKGIAAHILPYIFNKFYSQTKYGTGIGLAFCKMVMKAFGGDIICHSKEGEFTEFILSFPIIKDS